MREEELKTRMRFSLFELDRIIISILENIVNIKYVQNIKKLFYLFTESSYANDEDKIARVLLIRQLCDTICDEGIQSKDILLNTIIFNGKFANKETEVLNNVYDKTISEKETLALDKKISQLLKFATIEQTTDKLINTVNNIKSENYMDLETEINDVEDELSRIQKNLKDYRTAVDESNNTISLDSSEFLGRLNKIIEKEKNPSTTIRTGIKLLNEILDGGFKAGRQYYMALYLLQQ